MRRPQFVNSIRRYLQATLLVVISFLILFTLTIITAPKVLAAVGIYQTINFQGKLVNSSNLNVSDSSYSVVFTLYDASSGGTNLWTETQSVGTTDGVFRVSLGSVSSLSSVDFNSDTLWLGVKVGADAEMTPRIRFTAVPYAFQAKNVAWSGLTNPAANTALTMGTYTTTLTYSNATSTNNLFNLTDSASNSGTGYLLNVTTASGSSLKPFRVSAKGTEALMVDANGNVGVGTTAPGAKLEVAGQVKITGGSPGANKVLTSDANGLATWTALGAASITDDSLDFDKFADAMTLDAATKVNLAGFNYGFYGTGNVGIGTTSPTYKLDVSGTLGVGSTAYFASTVGIGTTAPSQLFEISGSSDVWSKLTSRNASGDAGQIFNNSADANNSWAIGRSNAGSFFINQSTTDYPAGTLTSRMAIDTSGNIGFSGTSASTTPSLFVGVNGNVGIGTTAPQQKLTVQNGTIVGVAGATTYTLNSVANGNQLFTSANGTAIIGANAGVIIPTQGANGSVGVVGASGQSTGGRTNIGVFGYSGMNQALSGNSSNNATGGYFLSDLTSAVTDFNGSMYGIRGRADSTTGASTGGSVYGGHFAGVGESNNTVYGGYFTATGGTTNYGVFSAAGTNYFNGNVGIGTSSPQELLTLNLGTVSNNTGNFGAHVTADAQGSIGYAGYELSLNNTTANATGYVRLSRTASTAYLGLEIASQSRDGIRFLTHASTPTEVMRIDASGNVGVGTSNPTALFSVGTGATSPFQINSSGNIVRLNGATTSFPSANSAGVLTNNGSGTLTWDTLGAASIDDDSLDFNKFEDILDLDSNTTVNMAGFNFGFQGTGNVGIGTTAPADKLHVTGGNIRIGSGNTNQGLLFNTGNYGFLDFDDASGDGVRLSGLGPLIFGSNTNAAYGASTFTENMRITAAGNVGIGTTNPAAKFEVAGGALVDYLGIGLAAPNSLRAINSQMDYTNTSGSTYSILNTVNINGGSASGSRNAYGSLNTITNNLDDGALDYDIFGNATTVTNSDGVNFDNGYISYNAFSNNDTSLTLGTIYGSYNQINNVTTGTISSAVGSYGSALNSGAGTMTTARALYGFTRNEEGTMTTGYGVEGRVDQTVAGGNIGTAFGGYFGVNITAGTIGTGYGVYINDIDGTNQFGLYQAGTTDKNYFAGSVGVGTTAPSALFSVGTGATSPFQINSSGNIVRLNGATTSFPSANSAGVLTNNGSGTLTWDTLGAASIDDDSLDFNKFEDILDLDSNTTVNMAGFNFGFQGTGNVGIGTTTPASALHVNGNISLPNAGRVRFDDGVGAYIAEAGNGLEFYAGSVGTSLGIDIDGNGNTQIGSAYFQQSSTGNVGIGTTAPTSKLQVAGDFAFDTADRHVMRGTIQRQSFYSASTAFNETGADIDLRMEGDTDQNLFYLDASTDRIGIGTATPANKLTVSGNADFAGNVGIGTTAPGAVVDAWGASGSNIVRIMPGTGAVGDSGYLSVNSRARFGYDGSAVVIDDAGTTKNIRFTSGGAERFTILSNGNVGVGTTAPATKLDVAGTGRFSSTLTASNGFTVTTGAISMSSTSSAWTASSGDIDLTTVAGGVVNVLTGNLKVGNGTPSLTLGGEDAYVEGTFEVDGISNFATNVGIGTTNPGAKLEITDATATVNPALILSGNLSAVNAGHSIDFRHSGATSFARIAGVTDPTGSTGELSFWTSTSINGPAVERLRIDGSGNVGIGNTNPTSLFSVGTGATSPFQINSSGNIIRLNGVATTFPSSNSAGVLTNNGSGTLTWDTLGAASIDDDSLDFNKFEDILDLDSNTTVNMAGFNFGFQGTGNVGIGTTAPGTKLDVVGTGRFSSTLTASNGFTVTTGAISMSSTSSAWTASSGDIDLTTVAGNVVNILTGNLKVGNGTNTLALNGEDAYVEGTFEVDGISTFGGNVGIGTTGPIAKLNIYQGDIVLDSGNTQTGLLYYRNNTSYGSTRNSGNISALGGQGGRIINRNTDFLSGTTTGYSSYNNGTGTITLSVVADSAAPNSSGNVMQISHIGSGTPSPGIGGFHSNLVKCTGTNDAVTTVNCYREGQRLMERIWAKIPVGYTINSASNSIGTGGSRLWVTSQAGTGEWEEYILMTTIGIGGTLSSSGHKYLTGANAAIDWYVASYQIVALDEQPTVDRAMTMNVGFNTGINLSFGQLASSNDAFFAINTGNVGIGTTAPGSKLEVISGSAGDGIRITGNSTNTPALSLYNGSTQGATFSLALSANAGLAGSAVNDAIIKNVQNNAILFGTNNTERMRISSGGNVGIGTTNPGNRLSIWDTTTTAIEIVSSTNMVGTFLQALENAGALGTSTDHPLSLTTNSLSRLVITETGNVGIGTTAPSALFSVGTGATSPFQINSSGNIIRLNGVTTTFPSSNSAGVLTNNGSGTLTWDTLGAASIDNDSLDFDKFQDIMDLDASTGVNMAGFNFGFQGTGNFGIGTTAPSQKFELVGSSGNTFLSSTGNVLGFTRNSANYIQSSTTGGYLNFVVNGNATGDATSALTLQADNDVIVQSGNLGIGDGTPDYKLTINQAISDPAAADYSAYLTNTTTLTANNAVTAIAGGLAVDSRLNQATFNASAALGLRGITAVARATGTGSTAATITGQVGVLTVLTNTGTGAVTNAYGFYNNPYSNTGGGSVTNNYSFYASAQTAGTNIYGFYSDIAASTNRYNFYADGTADNYFAGNVGIGTTAPGAKLDVNGGIMTSTSGLCISSCGVQLSRSSNDFLLTVTNAANMRFLTNNTERMRIDSSGNVGIGTTAPGQKLEVIGRVRVNNGTDSADFFTGSSGGLTAAHIGSITNIPLAFFTNSSAPRMVINTSGNVGIGTTAPSALFSVGTGATSPFQINSSGNIIRLNGVTTTFPSSNSAGVLTNNGSGTLTWDTLGAASIDNDSLDFDKFQDIMDLDASTGVNMAGFNFGFQGTGNFGIGTTAPTSQLHIIDGSGQFKFDASAVGSGYTTTISMDDFGLKIGHASSVRDIQFQTNSLTRMTIADNGNVGIGTTNPGYKLEVAGASGELIKLTPGTGSVTDSGYLGVNLRARFGYDGTLASVVIDDAGTTKPIRFSSGGAERLTILTGGNVGVGTTNPAAKFEVAGGALVDYLGIGTAAPVSTRAINAQMDLTNTSGSTYSFLNTLNINGGSASSTRDAYGIYTNITNNLDDGASALDIWGNRTTITNSNGVNYDVAYANYNNIVNNDTSLTQGTSYGSVSTINNTNTGTMTSTFGVYGSVLNTGEGSIPTARGIYGYVRNDEGTMTNGYGIQGVVEQEVAPGNLTNAYGGHFSVNIVAGTIGTGYGVYIGDIDGTNQFGLYQAGGTDKNYFGGNVGIGTTTPAGNLEISSDANSISRLKIDLKSASVNNGIELVSSNIGSGSNWIIAEGDTDTESFIVRGDGFVGIGTTAPSVALDVNGQARVRTLTGTATNPLCYDGTGILTPCAASSALTGSGTANYLARWTSAGNLGIGVVYDNGTNVGIGTTNPGTKLDVVGTGRFSSTLTASSGFTVTTGAISMSSTSSAWTASSGDIDLTTVAGNVVNILTGNLKVGNGTNTLALNGEDAYVEGTFEVDGISTFGGNVGIGTTAPVSLLDVRKTASDGEVARFRSVTATNNPYLAIMSNESANNITLTQSGSNYGNLIFNTGGFDRLTILSGGNVGIGTTNPTALFSVGTGATSPFQINSTGNIVRLNGAATSFPSANSAGVLTNNGSGTLTWDTLGAASIDDDSLDFAQFQDIMDLDAKTIVNMAGFNYGFQGSGNVGIGTTNPVEKLQIAGGNIRIDSGNTNQGLLFNTGNYGFLDFDDSSADGVRLSGLGPLIFGSNTNAAYGASTFTENMRILANGNVGIGTTAPSRLLHLSSSGAPSLRIDDTDDGRPAIISMDGSVLDIWSSGASGALGTITFRTGDGSGTERMRISGAGNVGIGTTAPAAMVHILGGSIYVASNPSFPAYRTEMNGITINFAGNAGADLASIQYGGTNRLQFTGSNQWFNSGNVGIGTTAPSYKLDVNGDIRTISYIYGSNLVAGTTGNYGVGTRGVYAPANSDLTIWTDNNNKDIYLTPHGSGDVLMNGSGNVGIGTTGPGTTLDVNGTIRAAGSTPKIELYHNGIPGIVGLLTAPNTYDFQLAASRGDQPLRLQGPAGLYFSTGGSSGSGGTERVRIDTSGNVGIGTTAPAAMVDILGGSIYVASNPSFPAYRTEMNGITINFAGNAGADLASIQYGGTNRLQFTGSNQWFNSGNVGIGTTAPAVKLDVNGSFRSWVAGQGDVKITHSGLVSTIEGNSGVTLALGADDTEAIRILTNGNVGIGTTAPAATFEVAGGALVDYLGIGAAAPVSTRAINAQMDLTNTSGTTYSFLNTLNINGGSASSTRDAYGVLTAITNNLDDGALDYDIFGNATTVTNSDGVNFDNGYISYNAFSNNDTSLTLGTIYGSYNQITNSTTGTIASSVGAYGTAYNNGAGTMTVARSLYGYTRNDEGTMTTAYGVEGRVDQLVAPGNITTAYGGNFGVNITAGTIGTGYGVYINDIDGNTQYGLYQAGATDTNYFAGEVGIGTNNPASILSVGSSSQFQVNSSGNIIKLNNVDVTFPSANSAGVLTNNGTGTLTWDTLGAASIDVDSLDFAQFQDIMDLDADTTVNMAGFSYGFQGTGNVGIGTTAPAQLLQISADSGVSVPTFRIDSADITVLDGQIIGAIDFYANDASTNGTGVGAAIKAIAEDNGTEGTATGLGFFTTQANINGATERVRIDEFGNVGIGTTAPVAKLTIGNNLATGFLDNFSEYQQVIYEGASASSSYGFGIKSNTVIFNSGGGGYSFDRGGNATTMFLDISGNVGIGTTDPTEALEVDGNIITTANRIAPHLVLDSIGSGSAWSNQGAYISLGESGDLGSAAMHMTYRGDGYGFIGAGTVDTNASTGGTPAGGYFRFAYNTANIYTDSNIDTDGTLTVGTANAFNVSLAGAVTAVGLDSGTGLIEGTGGLTVTGGTTINGTGSAATTIGNASAGALTLASGAASSINVGVSNPLSITSRNFTVDSNGQATLQSVTSGVQTSLAIVGKSGSTIYDSYIGMALTAGQLTVGSKVGNLVLRSDNGIQFSANSGANPQMTIITAGVGVGTTNPTAAFEVLGSTEINMTGSAVTSIGNASGGALTFASGAASSINVGVSNPLSITARNFTVDSNAQVTLKNTTSGVQTSIGFNGKNGATLYDSYVGMALTAGQLSVGSSVGNLVLRSDNGIKFSADSGATSQMTLTSGGDVGIGSTSPKGRLYIRGTASLPSLAAADGGIFGLYANLTQLVTTIEDTSPYLASIQHKHMNNGVSTYPIALNPLGGNVGIGTTAPGTTLDVTGTGRFSSTLTASSGLTVTTGAISMTSTSSAWTASSGSINLTTIASASVNILTGNLKVGNASSTLPLNGEDAYIEGTFEVDGVSTFGSNVGIGVTANITGVELQIGSGTLEQNIALNSAAGITQIMGRNSATGNVLEIATDPTGATGSQAILAVNNSNDLGLGANGQRVWIEAGGNVGIGTTAPISKLDIAGGARFDGSIFNANGGVNGLGDQESMLPNAGFEINEDASTTIADGWTSIISGTASTSIGVGTSAPQGEQSQALTTVSGFNSITLLSSCVPVTSGRDYYVAWRGRATAASSFTVGTGIYNYTTKSNCVSNTGAATAGLGAQNAATTVGNYESGTIGIGSTARWARAVIDYSTSVGATLYVDAVRLTPLNNTDGVDIAENFPVPENYDPEPGDVVTMGAPSEQGIAYAIPSTVAYDQDVFGIVSTKPGITLDDGEEYKKAAIALNGRVPVKVSTENGDIKVGDMLATSSKPGVAMKATKGGYVIGKAMEAYSNIDPDAVGRVVVLMNRTWFDPDVYFADGGDMQIVGNEIDYQVKRNDGSIVSRVGAFAEAVIGTVKSGSITANDITLSGKKLSETLTTILDELTAVKADIKAIKENPTSIGSDASMSAQLYDIKNSLDGSISEVSSDLADVQIWQSEAQTSIASIEAHLAALSETVLGASTLYEGSTGQSDGSQTGSALMNPNEVATASALTVTGKTNLYDLGVTGTITAGTLVIDGLNSSVYTLGVPLQIQPDALYGIEFLGGKIAMDKKGNLKIAKGRIEGNDTFRGKAILPTGTKTVRVQQTWDKKPNTVNVSTSFNSKVWVESIDATGFTIKVDTAPSNDADLHWFALW